MLENTMHQKSLDEQGECTDGSSEALASLPTIRKAYETPILILYGTLADLTAEGFEVPSNDPAAFSGQLS
jgi:hypothetical protein